MSTADVHIVQFGPAERLPLFPHALRIAWQNCRSSALVIAWLLLLAPVVALTRVAGDLACDPRSLWALFTIFTGSVAATTLADHFASSRAHLLPGYRRAHLAALIIVALAGCTISGALCAVWSAGPPWRYAGLIVCALAIGCWSLRSRWFGFGVSVAGTLLIVQHLRHPLGVLANLMSFAKTGLGDMLLIAVGGSLLVWFFWWLLHLDEDNRAYEAVRLIGIFSRLVLVPPRRIRWVQPDLIDGQSSSSKFVFGWHLAVRDRWLEAMLRRAATIPGWKILRWDLGRCSLPDTLNVGLFLPMFGLVVFLTAASQLGISNLGEPSRGMVLCGLAFALFFLQFITIVGAIGNSLPAVELLRPETRENLLKQWGASLLVPPLAALVLAIGYVAIEPLRRLTIGQAVDLDDVFLVFAWILLESALLALWTGLAVYIHSFRRMWLGILFGLLGFSPILVAGFLTERIERLSRLHLPTNRFDDTLLELDVWFVLAAAGVATVMTVLAFRGAYRRWLTVDLG